MGGLEDWMNRCMISYDLIDCHDEWMNKRMEREM